MKATGILLSVFTALLLSGCSKSSSTADPDPHIIDDNDVIAPVIEITTPGEGQVFSTGNTITITGKVTDGGGLYRGSIRITNDGNGSLVKEQLYEIHGLKLYNFTIAHLAAVTALADYTVTVRFEDHGSNVTTASVKVKVNP